jgi:2-iminobutanoate/2-iminopropanoate deaminase
MQSHGPYQPIVKAGEYYFVSGQVGLDASTKLAPSGIKVQTKLALDNLKSLLVNAGLELKDVVKTTIYLTNIDDFSVVNEIYVNYFEEPRPARACVEVSALPKLSENRLLIEIEAVAYKA